MLHLKDSVGITKLNSRIWYLFDCKECDSQIKVRKDHFQSHQGVCRTCRHVLFTNNCKKKPFQALYNKFIKYCKRKNIEMLISYEEFVLYTSINVCHYCCGTITWTKYNTQYYGGKFNLDRKDCNGSYSLNNCVICCSFCNYLKSNKFTYEEFLLLSPALKTIMNNKNTK